MAGGDNGKNQKPVTIPLLDVQMIYIWVLTIFELIYLNWCTPVIVKVWKTCKSVFHQIDSAENVLQD